MFNELTVWHGASTNINIKQGKIWLQFEIGHGFHCRYSIRVRTWELGQTCKGDKDSSGF